jgi:hypothetical protein
MSRGGRRAGGGKKPTADIGVEKVFITRSLKLRLETIGARIRELVRRDTEDSKTEAVKLSANGIKDMIDYVLPKLTSSTVVASASVTHKRAKDLTDDELAEIIARGGGSIDAQEDEFIPHPNVTRPLLLPQSDNINLPGTSGWSFKEDKQ